MTDFQLPAFVQKLPVNGDRDLYRIEFSSVFCGPGVVDELRGHGGELGFLVAAMRQLVTMRHDVEAALNELKDRAKAAKENG